MEKVIFRCLKCKVALSIPLVEDKELAQPRVEPNFIAQGCYVVLKHGVFIPGATGHFAIHLDDARNTERHPDIERLYGCCGPEGIHGLNTICVSGHEIGTEKSDCYTDRGLAFDPDSVEIERIVVADQQLQTPM